MNSSNSQQINTTLAPIETGATGWNLKKLMEKLKKELFWFYIFLEKFLKNFDQQMNNHKKLAPEWSW